MQEYQPFPVSNFRVGFDEAVEPWLLPREAYQSLINAHLYRGVLEKIDGYLLFASFSYRNIMSLGTPDGVTKIFTGTLPTLPTTTNITAYGTIVVGSSAETFSYSSDGTPPIVNLIGSATGTGTVNISTGAYSIEFNTAPPMDTYSSIFITWDSAPTTITAIMGIKQYYASNGGQDVLVFDQKRVGKIISISGIIAMQAGVDQGISELPHDYYESAIFTGDNMTSTFTGTLSGAPFVPGTLVWTEYLSTGEPTGGVIRDTGTGGLVGTGTSQTVSSGSINYVTGDYTITFGGNLATGNYFDSTTGLYGDLFTGTISNFFSLTNYQYNAFFVNNVDPVFYYDGTSVHYLNTSLSVKTITAVMGVPPFGLNGYDISTCLHVFTNRERLLLISPIVDGVMEVSTIYWSVAQNPLDFTNHDLLQAPTSEPIRAIGYINSDLIVRFANSERVFRYTNDAFAPFRFDSTNNIWACDAPYSSINYDTYFTSVGKPAIVGSDGVNVKRADEIIPDFTDPDRIFQQTPVPFMNQTSIQQSYGERFDDLKEGWLCYNSQPPAEGMTTTAADNVLSFNYLDGTYAVYEFPMSCLGFGRIINVPTWGNTFTEWQNADYAWGSFAGTFGALVDLGGDQYDRVYELDTGNSLTLPGDPTTTPHPVLFSAITKNFNPFIEQGQLCRFGYVDLFVSAYNTSTLRVQFYLNDELYIDGNGDPQGFYQETKLTFTTKDAMSPVNNQVKVWKRIYVGAVGKEHTIRFYQNEDDFGDTIDQPIYIHSFILNMKPAGRLFN